MSDIDLSKLENVHQSNGNTIAQCPACAETGGDNKCDHLFIAEDGKFGCVMFPGPEGAEHRKRIFALVGIKSERAPTGEKKSKLHATPDACTDAAKWGLEKATKATWKETRRDAYHNKAGEIVAYVVRFDRKDGATDKNGKPEKQFRPIHLEPGGWRTGDPVGLWPLFRLHEIGAEGPVYVVEGEKTAAAGVAVGLNCTTSSHGSKSPQKTDWTPFAGREVVVLPDNDTSGRKYAEAVAAILTALSPPAQVKIVKLPGLPPAGDLADFIKLRDDAVELVRKLADETEGLNAAPTEQPAPAAPPPEPPPSTQTEGVRAAQEEYGKPFWEKDDGRCTLNESFWAGLYAQENIVLHEPAERLFYRYDETRGLYVEHTADRIKTEIGARLLKAAAQWKKAGLTLCRTDNKLNAIVAHLRGQVEHRDAFSKKECRFVHLANGVIVFRDGDADFVEFSPEFRSRNQSPLAYTPGATCNRFLDELLYPALQPEDAVLIQKFAGLFLLGENIIQRFLILDGMPGGGKSQLVIVLQNLVGLLNCTQLRTEHLNERFEIFRFLKKTLLVGPDVPADFLNSKGASTIKSLVGGDLLDAERKGHIGSFPVEGRFNVVVTSNSRLRVKLEGDVGAWKRRTTIARYENPPPKKRIPDFGKLLIETEGPGILNWALMGLRDLLVDVADTGDVSLSPRQRNVVENLMAESDSLRMFLQDRVEGIAGHSITKTQIIEKYAEYCPSKGWNPLPITVIQRQLEGLMLELFRVVQSNSCGVNQKERGFRGVGFIGENLA